MEVILTAVLPPVFFFLGWVCKSMRNFADVRFVEVPKYPSFTIHERIPFVNGDVGVEMILTSIHYDTHRRITAELQDRKSYEEERMIR